MGQTRQRGSLSTSSTPAHSAPRRLRCAIYTRKSSDEGLEQSFNSLDAQRDSCEAFITSQKHEGWIALPAFYDDGGFSGGSMQRPALQRLLEDVSKRMIDVVVVYKVDRLTRSLADFAKLTELLEKHSVSFVSVTQQFNTSTSMGRLTLNVLLSFAQFEREVAGERIRDKIALSKRRGMWMGGLPPLGYDGVDRHLIIKKDEAETVRLIFRRYLEVGSIAELKRSLDAEGIVSKRRAFSDGRTYGGVPLSRGALYQILRNCLYRGEIAHRGEIHKGNHQAIVDNDLWQAVQDRLTEQSGRKRGLNGTVSPSVTSASLAGIVFDDHGHRLVPTHATKRGKRYRYYTSAPLTRGEKAQNGIRVPAPDLERLVSTAIADRLCDPIWLEMAVGQGVNPRRMQELIGRAAMVANSIAGGDGVDRTVATQADDVRELIERVVVRKGDVTIDLNRPAIHQAVGLADPDDAEDGEPDHDAPIEISVPARALRCGKQVRMIVGEVTSEDKLPDPDLIRLITDAARWFDDLRAGNAETIGDIAKRDNQHVSEVSRTLPLAFLAPDIVEIILDGRQPQTLTIERLKRRQSLPFLWSEQRALLLS